MKIFQFTIVSFLFLVLSFTLNAQGIEKYIPAVSNPPRLVNDYIDVLTPEQEQALEPKYHTIASTFQALTQHAAWTPCPNI